MGRFSTWLAVLLLVVSLAGCAPATPAGPTADPAEPASGESELRPVNLVIPGGSLRTIGNNLGEWGVATGKFAEYGLAVTPLFVDTGPQAVSAVLSGQADVAALGFYGVLGAIAEGADLKVVGQLAVSLPWAVLSKTEYTSIPDLKGARIGVDSPGSQPYYTWPPILRAHELSMDDVSLVPISGNRGRMDALIAGRVDAVVEPFDRIFLIQDQPGLHALDTAAGSYLPSAGGAILVSSSYIESHPDVVRDVVKSTIAMVRTFQTDYDAYQRMVGEVYEGRFTAEDTKWIWENLRDAKMWGVNGGINPKAIQQGIDFYIRDVNPEAAGNPNLTVENVLASDFVREALSDLGTFDAEWDPPPS